MHIGKRLYKMRKKLDLTQSEFSDGICSAEHLNDIEQGCTAAEAKLLQAFAQKLDVSDDYFLMYAIQDRMLAKKLKKYYETIYSGEVEDTEAEKIYTELATAYPLVECLEQELQLSLLRAYQLLKQLRLEEAYAFYKQEVAPLVHHDDDVPEQLKYVYFHTLALLYYYGREYIEGYEASMKQAKYTADEAERATCYYNAAISLYEMNAIRKVFTLGQSALQLYVKTGNYTKAAGTYALMGSASYRGDDFTKAIHYYQKALELAKQYEVKHLIWQSYNLLGLIYFKLGEFDISYEYYRQALPLIKEYPSGDQITVYTEFMTLLLKKEDYSEWNRVLHEAESVCSSADEQYRIDLVKAAYHLQQGDNDEYEKLSENAIVHLYEKRYLLAIEDAALQLSRYFEDRERYEEACRFMKIYAQVRTYAQKQEGDPPQNWSWQEEDELHQASV
jgi:HTH-type transcriptional regulator, quorum sensing regulator NprR